MATPLTADQFVKALKAEGVRVAEHPGWRTHNRNHMGAWGSMNGVLIHHTAGANSLRIVYSGRSDLPGPLAHTHLDKSGKATMVGNGRANHAGPVAKNAYNAVVSEAHTHPAPSRASGTVDGNAHFYGIEIENLGNGRDPYPEKQYDAAVRWAAAICRFHGWSAESVVGHKETSVEGKIDPSFSMATFRKDVSARLSHAASWSASNNEEPPTPTTPTGDTVPGTIGLYKAAPVTLTPGVWKTLSVGATADILTGAQSYTATAMLSVEPGPYASTVQGRFYHVRPDGTRWDSGIFETETTEGKTFAAFTHAGSIAPAEKLRFEVIYYPLDPTDTMTRDVLESRIRGLYWV